MVVETSVSPLLYHYRKLHSQFTCQLSIRPCTSIPGIEKQVSTKLLQVSTKSKFTDRVNVTPTRFVPLSYSL